MTDDVSKLPAWPEYPKFAPNYVEWLQKDRDAYRARMEALVEVTNGLRSHLGYSGDADREALMRKLAHLDSLLAACERRTDA